MHSHRVIMIFLNLPKLLLERSELIECLVGDVQSAGVVVGRTFRISVGLVGTECSHSEKSTPGRKSKKLTSLISRRKLNTSSFVFFFSADEAPFRAEDDGNSLDCLGAALD